MALQNLAQELLRWLWWDLRLLWNPSFQLLWPVCGFLRGFTILILSLFDQVSSLFTEWLWQSSLLVSCPAQDTLYTSKCQLLNLQVTGYHLCSGALFTWALDSQSACQDSLLATLSGWWVTPEYGAQLSSPDCSWEWSWSWFSPRSWDFTASSWQSTFMPRNK